MLVCWHVICGIFFEVGVLGRQIFAPAIESAKGENMMLNLKIFQRYVEILYFRLVFDYKI